MGKNKTGVEGFREIVMDKLVWCLAGFLLELGVSPFYCAPGAAALTAGISGKKGWWVLAGGVPAALLHGFPTAFVSLAAMAAVLAARLIPDFGNMKVRAAERFLIAAGTKFFSDFVQTTEPAQLLSAIIGAVVWGIFALSLCLLEKSLLSGGTDIFESANCAAAAVVSGLTFMSLGRLDYPVINVGRTALGLTMLITIGKKGLSGCGVIGLPALAGLCAADLQAGFGGALAAVSAIVCNGLGKYGKIAKAAGFVMLTAAGTLVCGIDAGSWKLIGEAAICGVIFSVIPAGWNRNGESGISDNSAALMLEERLNFAADAIAGIGSGITAAADTLDRKYGECYEQLTDRAAERVCRSCPNSMVCWGEKYELFSKEFSRLLAQLRTGFPLTEFSMSPECAEECVNRSGVAKAVTAEYSRYLSAMSDKRRIRELRRIYVDQLAGMQEILRGLASGETSGCGKNKFAEQRVEKVLREAGVELPQAFLINGRDGKIRLEAYGAAEPSLEREYLGKLLSDAVGCELSVPEIAGSAGRFRITAAEHTPLSARVGACQLAKSGNSVCGDCCESFGDGKGMFYIILSDGMGTGSRARVDSAMVCSMLSKLLKSGISMPAALETVNTVMLVKSADESFATLDICTIDLNSGECAVYKAGAATTYIKSSDKLLRATLSSPPAGSGGRLTVPAQKFTVADGDVIIMATDGAVLDEQWLSRELSKGIEPRELSERIARAARAAENGKCDDISVVAVELTG